MFPVRLLLLAALVLLPGWPLSALAAEDDAEKATETADDSDKKPEEEAETIKQASITLEDGSSLDYRVAFGCLPIGEKEHHPQGEICYTSYTKTDGEQVDADRPVTFSFNGGPGASSVYLHLGVGGPRRMVFPESGAIPRPPVRLQDNPQTWLLHSDLVFVDPVGTGFSWVLPPPGKEPHEAEGKTSDFWGYKQDLESLGRFMRVWLTRNKRWSSPKVLAGESYGGLRVAALMRELPGRHDIHINGAMLVSPAIDYTLLIQRQQHSLLHWIVSFPSLAESARWHGKGEFPMAAGQAANRRAAVEQFVRTDYISTLAQGASLPEANRKEFYQRVAAMLGLPVSFVEQKQGRIEYEAFAKELLRDQGLVLGRYDATLTGPDPERRNPWYGGGDPSFEFLTGAYAQAMMSYLTEELEIVRDQRYHALNRDVIGRWDFRNGYHGQQGFVGTGDEFSFGLTVAPQVEVLITHGLHDLVTPYFGSQYLVDQMDLPAEARARIRFANYDGGHMYYMREASHMAAARDTAAFYSRILKGLQP